MSGYSAGIEKVAAKLQEAVQAEAAEALEAEKESGVQVEPIITKSSDGKTISINLTINLNL